MGVGGAGEKGFEGWREEGMKRGPTPREIHGVRGGKKGFVEEGVGGGGGGGGGGVAQERERTFGVIRG